METLDIEQAAIFLKMNPQVLRRKAKAGEIPGRNTGKRWIFIKEHLADWISGRYPDHARPLQVIDGGKQPTEDKNPCQSTSVKKRGGYASPRGTADAYSNLLTLKTSKKPRNSTTD